MDTQPFVYVSGANSLYVYRYNNKLYFFFGDEHFSMENGCEQQYNIKCDVFDYGYENSVLYDTNCWTIGSLLDEWFTYNNYYGVKTDFYIETTFVKGTARIMSDVPATIIGRKQKEDYKFRPPELTGDWMNSITHYFGSCLIKEKKYCKYGPNVRFHYTDIRAYEIKPNYGPMQREITNFYLPIYSGPNSLSLSILKQIHNTNPNRSAYFEDVINNIQSIFILYNVLLDYTLITKLCFSTDNISDILNTIQLPKLSQSISKIYTETKLNIIKHSVMRNGILMTKTAAEFNRLSLSNQYIANKLVLYIHELLERELIEARKLNAELYEKFVIVLNRTDDILDDIININEDLRGVTVAISSIIMEVYTLSRMFIQQDSQQIITYAGYYHIIYQTGFFKYLGADVVIEHPVSSNSRCISSNLGHLLNINDFRNIYRQIRSPNIPPSIQPNNIPSIQSNNIPPIRSNIVPPIRSNNIPPIRSNIVPLIQSNNITLIQSNNIPSIQPNNIPSIQPNNFSSIQSTNVPSIQSTNIPLIRSNNIPSIRSTNIPLIQSNNIPPIRSNIVPLIQSNNIPVTIQSNIVPIPIQYIPLN